MRQIALVLGLVLAMQVSPAAAADDLVIVYFEHGRDDLSPRAKEQLRALAATYKASGQDLAHVNLSGHTDRAGDDSANIGLSQRRTMHVREYLVSIGIADGVITTEAYGESRPLVETADGVVELVNNRVEIFVGPGSGW